MHEGNCHAVVFFNVCGIFRVLGSGCNTQEQNYANRKGKAFQ